VSSLTIEIPALSFARVAKGVAGFHFRLSWINAFAAMIIVRSFMTQQV